MVVKFQLQQNRGAAGESIQGPRRGYNFANLYQANRGNEAEQRQQEFAGRAGQIRENQANTLQQANRGYSSGLGDAMAESVKQAKGLSNEAENFSLGNEAIKKGSSAAQSGLISFYGGGSGRTAGIRKFGNLYQESLGRRSDLESRKNTGIAPSAIQPEIPLQPTYGEGGSYDSSVALNQNRNQERNIAAGPKGDRLTGMTTLDWGLKTGRLTQEQYNRARNDPEYFNEITDWLNRQ